MNPPDDHRGFDAAAYTVAHRHYPDEQEDTWLSDPLPGEPWTELGYANRFVHVFADRVRYVSQWRRWLVWDGARWAKDDTGQAQRWMKAIARIMHATAEAEQSADTRRELLRQARRGESSPGVSGALKLASTHERIAITATELDADPFLLNCVNGVLDLRTGTLSAHDPALLLTKVTGTEYRPGADGPEFSEFLARIQPDEEMRGYLARLLGHSLAGQVKVHVLPILFGAGANGKGTLINAVLAALGDYGDAADPELLVARTFDAHPTSVADLHGMRLAVLHESDKGRRLAEGTVKRLTGGDRLKARRMREDFWHFDPSHTFVMLTNHKPIVSGTDEGIWRRLRLVPFDVVIPTAERDEQLGDRLALELPAVLSWLVGGYTAWHENEHGLDEPSAVTEATADYRAQSDVLARFLDERCLTGKHFHVRSGELYAAWREWCAESGEESGSQKAFSTELTNRGFDKHDDRRGAVWRGIGLSADD